MIEATTQDVPMTVARLFEFGEEQHPEQWAVQCRDGMSTRRLTFGQVSVRARRLTAVLQDAGIEEGDRVATLQWNSLRHLECYLGIPYGGFVLHTVNVRLARDQLLELMSDAEDAALICDREFLEVGIDLAKELPTLRTVISDIGDIKDDGRGDWALIDYERAVTSATPALQSPQLSEDAPAAMCYTSGTTGEPKGVVYSHRAVTLHALMECGAGALGFEQHDVVLPVVPMFHVNAWNMPYAGWIAGARLIMPGKDVSAAAISDIIGQEMVTVTAGVPTVFGDLLRHADDSDVEFGSLRLIVSGGSAVPEIMIEEYEKRFGVYMVQAWGMTETLSLATIAHVPHEAPESARWRATIGRAVPGVEIRIVDSDGKAVARDGESIGELLVRAPWVAGRYHRRPGHFDWLPTGDIAVRHANGFIELKDRLKDAIKSGGEWISSVQLEGLILRHPRVAEVAVIGIPDDRWQERPMAIIVLDDDGGLSTIPEDVTEFAENEIPEWWLPDRWELARELPRTGVGKVDKKQLRTSLPSSGS